VESSSVTEKPAVATSDKGLQTGVIGLLGSFVFGLASVAPAYSLALTIGLVAGIVGLASPFILFVGFVPMLLVSGGFYYMNRADPDCGETFIWTARAFGPQIGWVIGFASVAASVIVMANLGQIAAQYMFYFFGLNSLGDSTLWSTFGGVCWIVFVTIWVAIGIKMSEKVQYALMALQIVPLVIFTVWAIVKAVATHPAGYAPIRLSWFFTTHLTGNQLAAGVTLAVFLYWGWDVVTAINEESENSNTMPGISAVLNTLVIFLLYMLVTIAMQMYHGAAFLSKNSADVFAPLAKDVMGSPWDKIVLLCVFTSAAAAALSTLLPLTRQTLSMAAHKSLPEMFGEIHPKYLTPLKGTIILSALSILWYVMLTWINVNLLYDAVAALGIMISLAYGSTGLAATVYYRKELFKSAKNFILIGMAPSIGALMFAAVLIKVIADDLNPANSYARVFGVGGTLLMGVGVVVVGIILMIVMWVMRPEFFHRKPETWPGEGMPIPYADERVE
jgi:amino acid transporter